MIHQIAVDQLLRPEVFSHISIFDASTKNIRVVLDKNNTIGYSGILIERSIFLSRLIVNTYQTQNENEKWK